MLAFFFQAEAGIRDIGVTGVRRVLFRSQAEGLELRPLLPVRDQDRLPVHQGQPRALRHSALALALIGAAAFPATASAHGLIQRANLPIPETMFGVAAAVVLVVSFLALAVLWQQPRLTTDGWRPMPGGRILGSAVVETACGAAGVLLLVLTIVAGFAGTQNPLNNFATVFVFVIFWVGMALASLFLGDVFRAFNPWRALGR